ncbi:MAG: serine hydrolase [Flavobacteriales bacterium]
MKMISIPYRLICSQYLCAVVLTVLFSKNMHAQTSRDAALRNEIVSKDSLLFQVGFNTCDISQFEKLLSTDFEFYHDKDSISDKKIFLHDLRKGLCSSPDTYQSRRALISCEVYPLYKKNKLYGAVQNGVHQFYETAKAEPERMANSAKFTHLWVLVDGKWQLARALSYDHQQVDAGAGDQMSREELNERIRNSGVHTVGIGVIRNGKLIQTEIIQSDSIQNKASINTIFNVASLTKPVVAAMVLSLVEQGSWDLDEPLYHYWTDSDVQDDPNAKLLTARHVLSHQSGFSNWRGNNPDKKLHFEFKPGTKYQYSGEGFEYLRRALESKFKPPMDVMAEHILFDSLGMRNTRFRWSDMLDTTKCAIGHSSEGRPYPWPKRNRANAADDLLTTISDYGIFLEALMNNEILSDSMFNEMIAPQVKTKENKYFGLGFERYDLGNGEYALSHGGSDEGVQCIVFLLPQTKDGLLIFTNQDNGYIVFEKIITHYLGEKGRKIVEI